MEKTAEIKGYTAEEVAESRRIELEKDYKTQTERIAAEYKKNIDDYKNFVEKTEQDKLAFNAFVKKVIEAL